MMCRTSRSRTTTSSEATRRRSPSTTSPPARRSVGTSSGCTSGSRSAWTTRPSSATWAHSSAACRNPTRRSPRVVGRRRLTARLRLRAGEVLAGTGVDLDPVAVVDEQRDLDDLAGLQGGGLGGTGDPVALYAGLHVGDGELHRGGQLRADDLGAVEPQRRGHLRQQVVGDVLDHLAGHVELLEVLLVHEDVVVAVVVEELQFLGLDDGLFDPLTGPERTVHHRAVAHVLQLGADKRAALAGLDMLERDPVEQPVR